MTMQRNEDGNLVRAVRYAMTDSAGKTHRIILDLVNIEDFGENQARSQFLTHQIRSGHAPYDSHVVTRREILDHH